MSGDTASTLAERLRLVADLNENLPFGKKATDMFREAAAELERQAKALDEASRVHERVVEAATREVQRKVEAYDAARAQVKRDGYAHADTIREALDRVWEVIDREDENRGTRTEYRASALAALDALLAERDALREALRPLLSVALEEGYGSDPGGATGFPCGRNPR